ncbi:DEAD/DEAH box helicase [Acinetobacter variabilis]|uniref:DEAD/DEAH box helicase n=1 Tax=Acinetobacter variabilis TaxID=70346 RepID=UPI002899DD59|nr:DEAD/DEAH box helicase [Acinetobacter variabilis]
MSKTFAEFSLHESLQQALQGLGFTTPTPVQEQSIPAALEGKDLLVSSQTGSGKTAAFLLPTLNALANQDTFVPFKERMKAVTQPTILVISPTRELAQQVCQDAIAFVRHMKGVRIAAIMGGMPFGKQIQQLKGAQVVVATPGRLLDLVNRRQIKLDKVDSLIVDEADRMLDLGFSEDLEAIGDLAANRKQTLMFSATFAPRIITLAERMMNEPERIAIETGHSTNTDITQTLHWTDGFEHKKKLLTHWLNEEDVDQAVVFASTQEDTDMLAEELAEAGLSVVALHGAMPQTVRNRRLRSIREGRAKILVATDVAARGLDVPTISHVINFGLPMKNEDYVHRIGRTGRAGRTGKAITLATYRERGKIRALEDFLEARLNVSEIEGLEPSPPPARGSRDGAGRGRGGRRDGGRGFGGGRRFEGESNFKRREGGDDRPRRSFDDKPRGERPAFGGEDRPRRDFNSDRPRREGGFGDRPRRDFNEDRPRREFNNDRPRRDFGDRPRFEGNDDNRGNRVDYKPRREGSFGDRPKRDFGDRPARSFGDDRPARRNFDDKPRGERSFGEDRPRRKFND